MQLVNYEWRCKFVSSVRRSSSVVSNASTTTGSTSEENLTSSVENITDSIFVEASEAFNQSTAQNEIDNESAQELTEEEQIIREMDRDLPESAVRRRNVNDSAQPSTSSSTGTDAEPQKEEDKISIKLKYLNDEIKTVNAYLNETIGNFKR